MLNENELSALLNDLIPNLKELDKAYSSTDPKVRDKIIPFNHVYEMSVRQKRRIEIHAEDGVFPHDLFSKRAPNQTNEEYEYLEANYKSITLPVWQSFQSLLNRIWVEQNWKIDYNGNEEAQDYLEENYPLYGSIDAFFKDVVTNQKELDNNGVIAIKPYYIPTIETENGTMINDREYIDPIAYYYCSDDVLAFKKGHYTIILTAEKTFVDFGNARKKEGLVLEVYDDTFIYRLEQRGKKIDWDFEAIEWFKHDLGYVPVWKLNGKAKQVHDEVFYQSAFIPAVANLDRALLDDSYLTAKKAQVAYPHKWEYVSFCDYDDPNSGAKCIAGNITIDNHTSKCPSCKGSGTKASVMGVTQVPMPDMYSEATSRIAPPFLGFVEPGTDNLKFLREESDAAIAKGASMLKLDITKDSVTGSSKTATGDTIDREETFTLIKGISDQIFALFINSINAICDIRFGKDSEKPIITPPRTFEFRSDFDITEEITNLKLAGMPDVVIVQAIKEFMNIRFSLDANANNVLNLATYSDRLLTLSPDDILKKKASGTVAPWEDILHTSMYSIIAQALINDSNLFDKPLQDQKVAIETLAKTISSSINSSPASTSNILNNANA